MPVVDGAKIEPTSPFRGVSAIRAIDEQNGAKSLLMLGVTIAVGAKIALHTHNVEEAMAVTEGTGCARIDSETSDLRPGVYILAPAGMRHEIVNTGDVPMKLVCAFPATQVERHLVTE